MIVCICHCVSDRDIEREARRGCASFEALQQELAVATACGACDGCARKTFERAAAGGSAHPPHVHAVPVPARARPLRQIPIFAPRAAVAGAVA